LEVFDFDYLEIYDFNGLGIPMGDLTVYVNLRVYW